jgi:hypothetical protein
MNTQENNKLIADFMEYEFDVDVWVATLSNEDDTYLGKHLLFHSSWDWLMPVVEKIESFQDGNDGDSMRGHLYNFRIEQNFVYILDGESMDVIIEMNGDNKREATYKAVVEFIKQYNK